MISHLKGTCVDISERSIVLDIGGIGYEVATNTGSFSIRQATLHTHLVIREDAHELYGFQTKEERTFFKLLIGVSGVGPKTALHMLTLYSIGALAGLIDQKDAKGISLVPGVGKKTAEKIVIDLKDKVAPFMHLSSLTPARDLIEALQSLGYKEIAIREVVSEINQSLDLSAQITHALRLLSSKE